MKRRQRQQAAAASGSSKQADGQAKLGRSSYLLLAYLREHLADFRHLGLLLSRQWHSSAQASSQQPLQIC
jgi:hypothetical protein